MMAVESRAQQEDFSSRPRATATLAQRLNGKDFSIRAPQRIFEAAPWAANQDGAGRDIASMTSPPSPIEPGTPAEHVAGPSPFGRRMHWIFVGEQGLRAGWRVLIAACLMLGILDGLSAGLRHIQAIHAWAHQQTPGMFTPAQILFGEGLLAFSLLATVAIMMRIERKSFTDYGLPANAAFGMRFWQGAVFGFASLSLLLALIAARHGYSLGTRALGLEEAARYAAVYIVVFLLVAFFEEFCFRGYFQAALASGIGFWPAAVVLAALFGAGHLQNRGEAIFGAIMAGCFGLLAAFSLRRTENLWFAIGMHAVWDWGETYFYSVPDSGIVAQGHLFNSSFHGPAWLTGGTVGPEGSLFVFPVLALCAAAVHLLFPARQKSS